MRKGMHAVLNQSSSYSVNGEELGIQAARSREIE